MMASRKKQSHKVSTRSRHEYTEYSMNENDSELGDFDSDGYGYSCASPEMSSPTQFQGQSKVRRKKSKSDGNIPSRRKKSYSKAGYMDQRQAEETRIQQKKKSTRQEQEHYKCKDADYYSDGHWIAEEKRRRAEGRIRRKDHHSDGAGSLSRDLNRDHRSEESGWRPQQRRRLSRQERRKQSNRSRRQEFYPGSDNSVSEEEDEDVRHWKARGRRHQGGRKVSSAGLSFRRWPIKRRWTLDKELGSDKRAGASGDEIVGDATSQEKLEEKNDEERSASVAAGEDKPNEASDDLVKEDKADSQNEEEEAGEETSKVEDNVEEEKVACDNVKDDSKEEEEKEEVCQVDVDVHQQGEEENKGDAEKENLKAEDVEKKKEEVDEANQDVEEKEEENEEEKKDSRASSAASCSSSSSSDEESAKGPRRGSFFLPLSRSARVGKKVYLKFSFWSFWGIWVIF